MHVDRLADARGALDVRMVTQQARQRWLTVFIVLLTMSWTMTAAAAVCYVNGAASGAHTGASWTDAYTDLQSALIDANCIEVWVAQGVYKPTSTSNQTLSFNINPNVAVYGGFAGGETSRDARDPAAHVTILSGDIDNNDTGVNGIDDDSTKIAGSNSHHIVVMNGTAGTPITATTVLDGFTLTGGDNSATGDPTEGGGALWCKGGGAGHACSPTLARLVFSGNKANYGGALALEGYAGGASNPTLNNVTFRGNSATTFGGAMYNNGQLAGGNSSPTLTNVTFSGNSGATFGGAMTNDGTSGGTSSPTLTNVTFSGNSAVTWGGAIFDNGSGGTSSPTLTNVTFSGNSASYGGAMYNSGYSGGTSSPKLVNATFNGNSASYGGAIYNLNSYGPLLLNSILWGDSATTSGAEFLSSSGETTLYYSIVQGGCTVDCGGTSIFTGDPKLGALADNGGFTRTLMPGPSSPAINAVPCSYSSEEPLTDQRGAVRPDSASSGATRCDIGAVEANSLPGDLIFADRFGSSPWDDF